MTKLHQKGSLQYDGFTIRSDEQNRLISLTDMWKAVGSPENKAPSQWLRLPESKALASVLKLNMGLSHIYQTRRGRGGGTYGIPDLAIAYAEYLSPQFHAWALTAIKERIEEEAIPELAYERGRDRAIKGWKRQGKRDDWIQDRLNGIENYKTHTSTLSAHGVTNNGPGSNGFAACANAINKPILGGTSQQMKKTMGLTKLASLRDNLGRVSLTALSFAEAMADEHIEQRNLLGNSECESACSDSAGRVAYAMR